MCCWAKTLYAIFQPQADFYDKVMNPWKRVYNGKCNLTLNTGAQMELTIVHFLKHTKPFSPKGGVTGGRCIIMVVCTINT